MFEWISRVEHQFGPSTVNILPSGALGVFFTFTGSALFIVNWIDIVYLVDYDGELSRFIL